VTQVYNGELRASILRRPRFRITYASNNEPLQLHWKGREFRMQSRKGGIEDAANDGRRFRDHRRRARPLGELHSH
jgi:hypothetical protein